MLSSYVFSYLFASPRFPFLTRNPSGTRPQVLMPLSEKAAAIVMERADLLEGERIDPLLLQLVAHVSAYKVIMRRWREGDLREHSTIQYPEELFEWVSREFGRVKQRQAKLLGIHEHGVGGLFMRFALSKL